jgi:hypothetical protein
MSINVQYCVTSQVGPESTVIYNSTVSYTTAQPPRILVIEVNSSLDNFWNKKMDWRI